jgi:hypothetical protein
VAEALRRHDGEHLYLGSRFAWQTTEAVQACARWCDVVSFNIYKRSIADDRDEWARLHALGKPALIGEFHFGSTDRGLFWEGSSVRAEKANAAPPMPATCARLLIIQILSEPIGSKISMNQ